MLIFANRIGTIGKPSICIHFLYLVWLRAIISFVEENTLKLLSSASNDLQTAIDKFAQMKKTHKCFASIRFDLKMFLFQFRVLGNNPTNNIFEEVEEEHVKYVKLFDFFPFFHYSSKNSPFPKRKFNLPACTRCSTVTDTQLTTRKPRSKLF